jgi:cytidylate kinase
VSKPKTFVIAIDGPAASGKSSTAHWVAQRLGVRYADSGALYRAVTAARLRDSGERDAANWTEADVLDSARRRVRMTPNAQAFVVELDGAPREEELRSTEVTSRVSAVARMPGVRSWVNEQMRGAAAQGSIVVDGRDMGTAVFPEAAVKIWLVADPWERARRRLTQALKRAPTEEEIADETDRLVHRDAKDATQTVQAPDAVLVDTTYLTQEEQVDRIVALARTSATRGSESG